MKAKSFILAAAAGLLTLIGCNKGSEELPGMKITLPGDAATTGIINVPATGGSPVEVKVQSSREWKVECSANWLIFAQNGKDIDGEVIPAGEVTVTITAQPNTGVERTADVTFNGGTVAKDSFKVKQAGGASFTTIAALRAMLTGDSATIADGVVIKGLVNSNATLDNLGSSKSLYMQDETGGINVFCKENHSFAFGDEIAIDLSGKTLYLYNKSIEVVDSVEGTSTVGLDNSVITEISQGNTIEPKAISIADLIANKYESVYVSVPDVQVADSDLSKNWVVGDNATSINMVAKTGETFVVRSGKYSSYKAEKVAQGSGTIKGIATIYGTTIQLIFAQADDYAGLTGERFVVKGSKLTVDEVITKKSGNVTVVGRVIATSPAGFVINDGTQKNLYVSMKKAGVSLDAIVEVSGSMTTYGNAARLEATSVAASTETVAATPTQETTVLSADKIVAFNPSGSAAKVQIEGVLSQTPATEDGETIIYNNLAFDGFSKPDGSVYTNLDLKDFVDKKIKVTGYFAGSTSNHWMVVSDNVEEVSIPYLTTDKTEIKVAYTETSATIQVTSNTSWTAASVASGFTVSPASGTGNGTITVSFAANTAYVAREASIQITPSEGEAKTVKIIQAAAPDPDAKFVELTNEEIKAYYATFPASTSGYVDVNISSASGTWSGLCYVQTTKDGSVSTSYIQINNKSKYHLTSPVFDSDIVKVEFNLADKNTTPRNIYCIPADTELPTTSYNTDSTLAAKAYGHAANTEKNKEETLTVDFTGVSTKQFTMIPWEGAIYVNSIKVYLKK